MSPREEALVLLRQGLSSYAVAPRVGAHHATVDRWRRQAGIAPTRTPQTDATKARAVQMIRDGVSISQVARTLGVRRPTVQTWWRMTGEKRPPRVKKPPRKSRAKAPARPAPAPRPLDRAARLVLIRERHRIYVTRRAGAALLRGLQRPS